MAGQIFNVIAYLSATQWYMPVFFYKHCVFEQRMELYIAFISRYTAEAKKFVWHVDLLGIANEMEDYLLKTLNKNDHRVSCCACFSDTHLSGFFLHLLERPRQFQRICILLRLVDSFANGERSYY